MEVISIIPGLLKTACMKSIYHAVPLKEVDDTRGFDGRWCGYMKNYGAPDHRIFHLPHLPCITAGFCWRVADGDRQKHKSPLTLTVVAWDMGIFVDGERQLLALCRVRSRTPV